MKSAILSMMHNQGDSNGAVIKIKIMELRYQMMMRSTYRHDASIEITLCKIL